MLRAEDARIDGVRSVASGGEPLGPEMLDWGRRAFGLTINEFYGQTECNMVASSCAALFPPRPGCLGRITGIRKHGAGRVDQIEAGMRHAVDDRLGPVGRAVW
jgi:acyl-coenzyme A synthetase/AMP-(fatty) acid ligase